MRACVCVRVRTHVRACVPSASRLLREAVRSPRCCRGRGLSVPRSLSEAVFLSDSPGSRPQGLLLLQFRGHRRQAPAAEAEREQDAHRGLGERACAGGGRVSASTGICVWGTSALEMAPKVRKTKPRLSRVCFAASIRGPADTRCLKRPACARRRRRPSAQPRWGAGPGTDGAASTAGAAPERANAQLRVAVAPVPARSPSVCRAHPLPRVPRRCRLSPLHSP